VDGGKSLGGSSHWSVFSYLISCDIRYANFLDVRDSAIAVPRRILTLNQGQTVSCLLEQIAKKIYGLTLRHFNTALQPIMGTDASDFCDRGDTFTITRGGMDKLNSTAFYSRKIICGRNHFRGSRRGWNSEVDDMDDGQRKIPL
jgi:hypothetical protein